MRVFVYWNLLSTRQQVLKQKLYPLGPKSSQNYSISRTILAGSNSLHPLGRARDLPSSLILKKYLYPSFSFSYWKSCSCTLSIFFIVFAQAFVAFTHNLPPFLLIRDRFGRQNIRGNVSKISVNLTCYRHIGSKSTNHSPLAWRREGQKVTLMSVIGGFRSDLSITRMTDGNFGNDSAGVLFSKVENGGKRAVEPRKVFIMPVHYKKILPTRQPIRTCVLL